MSPRRRTATACPFKVGDRIRAVAIFEQHRYKPGEIHVVTQIDPNDISDGDTRNPESAHKKIRSIRGIGCLIHGLGLGPGSNQNAALIPGSPTNLTPKQLPEVFACLLQSRSFPAPLFPSYAECP
jgi:hypothetical protein